MIEYKIHPLILSLLQSHSITSREALVLVVLEGGGSNAEMGAVIGVSSKTISNTLTHLRSKGLLPKRSCMNSPNPGTIPHSREGDIPISGKSSPNPGIVPHSRDEGPTGGIEFNVLTRAGTREDIPPEGSPKGSPSGVKDRKTPPKKRKAPPHPRWMKFASTLGEAIASVRKIAITTKLGGWATSFKNLHKRDGVPIQRIRQVLKWYCLQIEEGDLMKDNSRFIPIAYSGASFREKFLRIEGAKARNAPEEEKAKPHINPEREDYSYISEDPEEAEAILDKEMKDHNALWNEISSRSEEE